MRYLKENISKVVLLDVFWITHKWSSCIYFKKFLSWNKSIESRESTTSTFHTWHQTHKRPGGVPITCGRSFFSRLKYEKIVRFWEATLFALEAEIIFFSNGGCVRKKNYLFTIYIINFQPIVGPFHFYKDWWQIKKRLRKVRK